MSKRTDGIPGSNPDRFATTRKAAGAVEVAGAGRGDPLVGACGNSLFSLFSLFIREYRRSRVMGCIGKTRRERTDGDVGRDWAGEAADFGTARVARCRTDKAGRPAQGAGNHRTCAGTIRRESGYNQEANGSTPDEDCAG